MDDEMNRILKAELDGLNFDELNEAGNLNSSGDANIHIFDSMTVEELSEKILDGESLFDSEMVIADLKDLLLGEIKTGLYLGIEALAICIIIGLLKNLSSGFGKESVSQISVLICCGCLIGICLTNIRDVYSLSLNSVATMVNIMLVLLPILVPILISTGGFSSGAVLNPAIMGIITAFNTVIKNIILPALFISTVLLMINCLTNRSYVARLGKLIRTVSLFIMGISVTVFSGLTAIQGFVTGTADSVLADGTRYSLNSFVPVVGGFAADSLDMFITCMGVIKNAVGIYGIILIISVIAFPIIKLLAIAFIFKVTAALSEPVAEGNISECFEQMGTSVVMFAVIVSLSAFLFIIFITIILSIGGGQ